MRAEKSATHSYTHMHQTFFSSIYTWNKRDYIFIFSLFLWFSLAIFLWCAILFSARSLLLLLVGDSLILSNNSVFIREITTVLFEFFKAPITCTCLSVRFGRYFKWIFTVKSKRWFRCALFGCRAMKSCCGCASVCSYYVCTVYIPSIFRGIILSTWQFRKFSEHFKRQSWLVTQSWPSLRSLSLSISSPSLFVSLNRPLNVLCMLSKGSILYRVYSHHFTVLTSAWFFM